MRPQHLIAASIEASLEYLSPAAVFVNTRTGATARRLAAFHLPAWIVAMGDQEKTCQDLLFSYGVHPVYQPKPPASWRSYVKEWLQRHEVPGEFALVTHGPAARGGSDPWDGSYRTVSLNKRGQRQADCRCSRLASSPPEGLYGSFGDFAPNERPLLNDNMLV